MSRSSRAVVLLADWKRHPIGCTEAHGGWADGYEGPCTDDEWEVIVALDEIDPMFHGDAEAERDQARAELAALRAAIGALVDEVSDYRIAGPLRALLGDDR